MTVKLAKLGADIGIVVRNAEECLKFYRDFLGLEYESELDAPIGHMDRLKVGNSILQLVSINTNPQEVNPPDGFRGAAGLRYWTIQVENIDELHERCQKSGYKVPIALNEIRPGVLMFIVEDPDGNWLEILKNK